MLISKGLGYNRFCIKITKLIQVKIYVGIWSKNLLIVES